MFVLGSDITIGSFRFSGVHEAKIKRSVHSYVDTASIQIPSIGSIKYKTNSSNPKIEVLGTKFKDGDKITINLGYDGKMQQEFRGFVKKRDLNMPLTIECEGYSYQLARNSISGNWSSISVKDFLSKAITGTDITLQCTVDMQVRNVKANKNTGAQIIDYIHKLTDGTLGIFFIQPDVLWCGLLYTPYIQGTDPLSMGSVQYRLGYNCIKDNALKEKTITDNPIIHQYGKRLVNGTQLVAQSDPYKGELVKLTQKKILNHIDGQALLKKLAQEKAYRANYEGYEGHITAFLQPYCLPGYKAYITDNRYPERNGTYLVETVEVIFGQNGARRTIEIGPKLSV